MTDGQKQDAPAQPTLVGSNGAEIFHEMLLEEGVDILFGYPGGAVLPIFDVLYASPIKFILTRHEQGAAHMADAYARSTGRVGTVLVTSGPGATNIVTGLATAYMDSSPMVAFTGQVMSHLIGNDAFQEADVTGITRPVTKHNFLVRKVEDIGRIVKEAFHIARTGRPGPVLVDIPVDIARTKLQTPCDRAIRLPGYKPRTSGHIRQIKMASDAINAAHKPLLYVGGGVVIAGAAPQLRAIMDKGQIPVTTTLMAMGAVDETHPLALQMLGMHGSATANYAVQECDCLVAVAARFDDRVTGKLAEFAPHAKIIHIDVDPASISKNVKVDIPVVGDAKWILQKMVEFIEPRDWAAWHKQIAEWKAKYPFHYEAKGDIKPQEAIDRIGELTGHDAIICTGVGQHQMWTAQFYGSRKPRQMITSGGLGTMGFGCPAAIGAQVGNPGATVIDIDGDGSFSMTMVEVLTAVRYNIPAKFVVLNNDYLGMVRQWQELFYGRRYSAVDHPCPGFAKIAEAYGAKGILVEDRKDLDGAIRELLASEGPAVLDVHVEKEENVFPMVAPGKSLSDLDLGRLA